MTYGPRESEESDDGIKKEQEKLMAKGLEQGLELGELGVGPEIEWPCRPWLAVQPVMFAQAGRLWGLPPHLRGRSLIGPGSRLVLKRVTASILSCLTPKLERIPSIPS